MSDLKIDHATEAESYLRNLDSLDAADAYVAVIAAQTHANLAQLEPAREMVALQRALLTSMEVPVVPPEQAPDSIEEQVKPTIEEPTEPTEYGSIILARADEREERVRWSKPTAEPGWFSEHGAFVGGYQMLSDVEVLRIGVGEAESTEEEIDQQAAEAQQKMANWEPVGESSPGLNVAYLNGFKAGLKAAGES